MDQQSGDEAFFANRFCTNCGKALESGALFCTNCGMRVVQVEDDAEDDARVEPDAAASVDIAATADVVAATDARAGAGKKAILITVAIAVVVVAAAAVIAFAVFSKGCSSDVPQQESEAASSASSASDAADASSASASTSQPAVVSLSETYTTRFEKVSHVTYPAFTFGYPSTWEVTHEGVSSSTEEVVVSSEDGLAVRYLQMAGSSTGTVGAMSFGDLEKVADADFVPRAVQGTNHAGLGSFVVAKSAVEKDGKAVGTCYALVPALALDDPQFLSVETGAPGFSYSSALSFTCMTDQALSEQDEREVVAILASFKTADKSAGAASSSASGASASNGKFSSGSSSVSSSSASKSASKDADAYVLADSASRLYERSVLEDMSNYDLYLARNEIYARHGRMFDNEDLKEYFEGKSWYNPRYTPEEFDHESLNATEKKNAETMMAIEQERKSPYLK